MTKVLTGHDGFKNLDLAGRKAKIDELAARHVEYLKDTVADLLSELKWEATSAQAASKVTEPGKTANDNPEIKTDKVETEEEETEISRTSFILPKVLGRYAVLRRARQSYESIK